MSFYKQVKVGPELLTPSGESWIAYYAFAFLTIASLGGGYWLLRRSELTGPDYFLGLLGVLILTVACAGITIMCHLMGHLLDEVAELRKRGGE